MAIKFKILLVLLGALMVCCVGVFGYNYSQPSSISSQQGAAKAMCEKFIKDRLNISDASFSASQAVGISAKPSNYYSVSGDVNGTEYRCDLHHQSDDASRWTLDKLTIK